MLSAYVPILILFGFMVILSLALIGMSHLFSSGKYSSRKKFEEPYECGLSTGGIKQARYPVHFYLVAIDFVIFDVEAVFLWPWAVSFRSFSEFGHVMYWYGGMMVFLFVLLAGYLYLVGKGTLNWN